MEASWELQASGFSGGLPAAPEPAACALPRLRSDLRTGRPPSGSRRPAQRGTRAYCSHTNAPAVPAKSVPILYFVSATCVDRTRVCKKKSLTDSPIVASRPILLMVENM